MAEIDISSDLLRRLRAHADAAGIEPRRFAEQLTVYANGSSFPGGPAGWLAALLEAHEQAREESPGPTHTTGVLKS